MKITFSCPEHLKDVLPKPKNAIKELPEYYKKIKPQSNVNPGSSTVKRCVPFLDALSAGCIIPMWSDVFVLANKGDLTIDFPKPTRLTDTLDKHVIEQIPGHPLESTTYGKLPLKWSNPWIIKTEEGVSCLLTSPLNHLETRFKLFDAVVDTDTYYSYINLPFLWTGGDGEFLIKKGTPLVQVIPFRREETEIAFEETDEEAYNRVGGTIGSVMHGAYRNNFWHKRKQQDNE